MTWNQDRESIIAAAELGDAPAKTAVALLVDARKRAFDAEHKAQQLQAKLDALKAAHAWIKTSERMPDNDARKVLVIICGKGSKRVELADYYSAQWSIGDEGYGLEEYETVTHWQPLPEAPK